MPQSYLAATQVAKGIMVTASSAAASAAGIGVSTQLNQTHAFLHLQLPLWYFYIAMIILSFVGAFWALFTDTMQSRGNPFLKAVVAFTVGIVSSFVILPLFSEEPPLAVMLVVALAGSFSGTVLLFLIADVMNDQQLRADVLKILKTGVIDIIRMAVNRVKSVITVIFKGDGK
jgi:hypothetical protein